MASNVPEVLTERTLKRKANDSEDDEKASLGNETSSSRKANLHGRKRRELSSPLESDYTSWSELGDEADSSCSKGPHAEKENYSASHWTYKDLMRLNIFYEETPVPIEKLIKEVKDALMNSEGFCPDPSKITNPFKEKLEEILTFSYDLKKVRRILRWDRKCMEAQEVEEEMKKSIQMAMEMSEKALFDKETLESPVGKFAQLCVGHLKSALVTFAGETENLIKLVLNGEGKPVYHSQTCETDHMSASKEKQRERRKGRGGRARGGHGGSQDRHDDSKCGQTTELNVFQNYCRLFGNLFFLHDSYIPQRSFSFQNKKLKNVPDLVYHFYTGTKDLLRKDIVFFVEVINAPVTEDATDIRQLVGQNVMGQFGAELLCQSLHSPFYPNSLGILCMETKLIFVFLKISDEHVTGIHLGDRGSANDPGKVIYTEPFDMLKAEDRLKIAEFLFWLGIVQDSNRYNFF